MIGSGQPQSFQTGASSRQAHSPLASAGSFNQHISVLIRDGFSLHNQRGSHQRYRHVDGRRVTITYHRPGDTFPMGTLRSMIEIQARWTEADLRRLSLLR
jgi:predicted RNA binding protein YcfA (HicA-like mRNA interferase family)